MELINLRGLINMDEYQKALLEVRRKIWANRPTCSECGKKMALNYSVYGGWECRACPSSYYHGTECHCWECVSE